MKPIFYIVCLVSVSIAAGVTFHWIQEHTSPRKRVSAEMSHVDKETATTEKEPVPSAFAATPDKKGCGCCQTALEKVKQKRKELEMWAREMIATHGYDEGMKRVTAKSPTADALLIFPRGL